MMKKGIIGLLLVCLFNCSLFALSADIVLKSYFNLDEPYVELYTFIVNEEFSDTLESLIVISNESEIVVAEKYLYQSSEDDVSDLIDIKRFNLPNGNYTIRVEIFDINDTERYFTYSNSFELDFATDSFRQSDLFLGFESTTNSDDLKKLNVSVEPMVFEFSRNQKQLVIYNELYNVDKLSEDHYMTLTLKESDIEKPLMKKVEKLKGSNFVPSLIIFPIDEIPSGRYSVQCQIHDRQKNVISERTQSFNISNAQADLFREVNYNSSFENSWIHDLTEEEVIYGIKAIYPKLTFSNTDMIEFVLGSKDPNIQKYYLFKFWSDQAPDYPEEMYKKYMKIAAAVDKTYQKNVGLGFESDRGYVFLKYGRPNDLIAVEDEPTAPPYEIWIYHHVPQTGQTNIKFLFYNPSLATNDYIMLHSNARGEINNPRWEIDLYGDDPTVNANRTFDSRSATDGFNRRAREFFNDF